MPSLCKDCPAGTKRKAPHPGPRCATHHRLVLAERRKATRDRRIEQQYGITAEEYDRIYEHQGGTCYICQRAKGTGRRRLAVDHNHETGEVRGLLCKPCNRDVLGHLRDEIAALQRAIDYLTNPPARAVLGEARFSSARDTDRSHPRITGRHPPAQRKRRVAKDAVLRSRRPQPVSHR